MIVCADVTLASARSQWRNAIVFTQKPGKRERLAMKGVLDGHQRPNKGGWQLMIYGRWCVLSVALHAPHGVQLDFAMN